MRNVCEAYVGALDAGTDDSATFDAPADLALTMPDAGLDADPPPMPDARVDTTPDPEPDAPVSNTPDLPPTPDAPPDSPGAPPDSPPAIAPDVVDATPAPRLSPADLPGLALWLDAAKGVTTGAGQHVTTWNDQSPRAHVATTVGAGRATLIAGSGGRPGVRLGNNGGETAFLSVPDHESLRWGQSDFLIAAVVAYQNSPFGGAQNYAIVYIKTLDQPPYAGPGLFLNNPWPFFLDGQDVSTAILTQTLSDPAFFVASPKTGYNDGKVHLLIAHRRQRSTILRVDGEAAGAITTPWVQDVSVPGQAVAIGAYPHLGKHQLQGEIYELFAVAGETSDAEIAGLERYLADKHQLTLPP
jgi:hypothetical protein